MTAPAHRSSREEQRHPSCGVAGLCVAQVLWLCPVAVLAGNGEIGTVCPLLQETTQHRASPVRASEETHSGPFKGDGACC